MPRIDDILTARTERKREQTDGGPSALPFEAVLMTSAQRTDRAANTPGGRQAQARQQAEQPREGVTLAFESSRKRSRPGASETAQNLTKTPGKHAAAASDKPGEVQKSPWDRAQKTKAAVAEMLPGRGSEKGGKADGESLRLVKPKAISLEARGVSLRADGTPILRDSKGAARVVFARNPDKALGPWLRNEADEAEVKRALREAFEHKKRPEPVRTPEAYARRSEQIRADAPVKLAEQIRRDVNDPTRLEVLNNRNAGLSERQAELREQPAAPEGRETDRAWRGTRSDGSGNQREFQHNAQHRESKPESGNKETRSSSGRFGDEATRAGLTAARSAPKAAGTGVAATEGNLPPLKIDATPVANALQQGARAEAASRMATMLNARVDYMLNQQRPELRLQLSPRDMGSIHIRLIAAGDNHLMRIQADRHATVRVIEQAVPQLVQQLQKVGVQVSQVAVDYGSTDFTQTGQGGQANTSRQDGQGQSREAHDFPSENAPQDSPPQEAKAPVSTHDGELDVLA